MFFAHTHLNALFVIHKGLLHLALTFWGTYKLMAFIYFHIVLAGNNAKLIMANFPLTNDRITS